MKKYEALIRQLFNDELLNLDQLSYTAKNGTLKIEFNGISFDFEYQGSRTFSDFDIEFELPYEIFQEINVCPHCEGSKVIEVRRCVDPSNECCGGCVDYEDCECELPFED